MGLRLVAAFLACLCLAEAARPPTNSEWTEILQACRSRDPAVQNTVPISSDCRLYTSCPFPSLRIPIIQHCAAGNFYNAETQICDFSENVNCDGRNDPCSGQQDGYIEDPVRTENNRVAVLRCEGRRTVASFNCEQCYGFGGGETGCVPITNCVAEPVTYPSGCYNEPMADNPNQYIAIGEGTRTVMDCAGGTTFNAELCLCA